MELIIKGIDFFFKFNLEKFRFPTIIVIVPLSFFHGTNCRRETGGIVAKFRTFRCFSGKKMKNESDLKHRFKKKHGGGPCWNVAVERLITTWEERMFTV